MFGRLKNCGCFEGVAGIDGGSIPSLAEIRSSSKRFGVGGTLGVVSTSLLFPARRTVKLGLANALASFKNVGSPLNEVREEIS